MRAIFTSDDCDETVGETITNIVRIATLLAAIVCQTADRGSREPATENRTDPVSEHGRAERGNAMASRDQAGVSTSPTPTGPAAAAQESADLRYIQAPNRREKIVARVRTAGFISILDLAVELGVSEMTVRRDVRKLEVDGELKVVHGGISLTHATLRTSEFNARAQTNAAGKAAIARAAGALVKPKDVVGFDAGSTAFQVAAQLPSDFDGLVITHSVPVIQHLLHLPSTRVTGLGGDLYVPSQAFVGRTTTAQIAGLRTRLFFLGAAAIDQQGIYVEAGIEVNTKIALMNAATTVVAVVDSQKFHQGAPVLLCGLDRIDILITDIQPDAEMTATLLQAGVEVTVAN